MFNSIFEWNPRESYKEYDDDSMYAMDYVAKVILESGYIPIKSLKDYVLTVIKVTDLWNNRPHNSPGNTSYTISSIQDVKNIIDNHYSAFDKDGHWDLFLKNSQENYDYSSDK